MKKSDSIEQVLTREVVTAHTGQSISDIRRTLAKEGFHHVPVVSGRKLIGLISATDILGISVEGIPADERSMDAYLDHQFSVEGIMQQDLHTLPVDSTIADAAEVLSSGDFHSVPVIDAGGNLEGIVTSTDLIRYLRDQF